MTFSMIHDHFLISCVPTVFTLIVFSSERINFFIIMPTLTMHLHNHLLEYFSACLLLCPALQNLHGFQIILFRTREKHKLLTVCFSH